MANQLVSNCCDAPMEDWNHENKGVCPDCLNICRVVEPLDAVHFEDLGDDKTCVVCHKAKSRSEFTANFNLADGRINTCKDCHKERYKVARTSDPSERGRLSAQTVKERYGKDFYRRIGKQGGEKSRGGGFAANRELAREAGRRGGMVSKRKKRGIFSE